MKNGKILFVLIQPFDSSTGGVQMSTFKLSTYFSSIGIDTYVYSFSNTGHVEQNFTTLIASPGQNRHYNPANLRHLAQSVDGMKPDIVINQMPYEHAIGAVLARKQRAFGYLLLGCLRNTLFSVKLNLDSYLDMTMPKPLRPFLRNKFGFALLLALHKRKHAADLRKLLDTYDYFVMFGPPNKKEIEYFIGNYKENKLAYIPNSIPSVLPAIPPKEKRILWLSRLSYKQKRAELIIPVWEEVGDALPDWELDIVGDGDAYDDIRKQIAVKKIQRVTVHGRQKADAYFKRSPIYFMTSSFEGFPNTVIEAQSFGAVPVVFNSFPMLDWIIEDKVNGVLVKPFDTHKMAQEIIAIARDQERQMRMMEHALTNANRFAIEKVGQLWTKFFKENIKQPVSV